MIQGAKVMSRVPPLAWVGQTIRRSQAANMANTKRPGGWIHGAPSIRVRHPPRPTLSRRRMCPCPIGGCACGVRQAAIQGHSALSITTVKFNVGLLPSPPALWRSAAASNGVKVNDRIIAINEEALPIPMDVIEFGNKVARAKLDGPVRITFETPV